MLIFDNSVIDLTWHCTATRIQTEQGDLCLKIYVRIGIKVMNGFSGTLKIIFFGNIYDSTLYGRMIHSIALSLPFSKGSKIDTRFISL